MHSLEPSRPADFRERFLPTQTTVSGNTGPKRTTSLPSISPAPSQPPSTTVVAGNFHGTGRASGARQDYKRHLRRIEAIEVRGIHHRASHSFRTTKGDSAEFSAEVGRKF
ncbi:DNAse I-like superfamily protein [Prunus dulcis]|uniref:DNAse I-like superfamily protein n=1 Tax=Prunus dulcis TaxID=3755 RepID=A0A4Y1QTL9_PRUDU|nr:DNAse I-like superfamily protein [Prunus dulcis]